MATATFGRALQGGLSQHAAQQRGQSRRTLRVRAVLATPQTEQQHASEIGSLKKAAVITAVKTP